MGNNVFASQLYGPFKAKEELYTKIVENCKWTCHYVKHLGVQVEKDTIIYINEKPVKVGRTGIYEIGNTEVTSIYFENDTKENTIIDYTIESEEEWSMEEENI